MGFGAFIAQLFGSVMQNTLPQIQADLDLSFSMQTQVLSVYFLAFGVALVAGGRLGDLIGEVKMIVIGYSVFGVALIIAATAPDGLILVLSRALQGVGIGISAPATLSIVVNSFPFHRRGMAVGTWGAAHGFGILAGPLIGGAIVETLTWRWVFWITVPLTLLVIAATIAASRHYRSVLAHGSYDFIGLIVGGAAVVALTYGFQNSSTSWSSPWTWGLLIASVTLFVAFILIEPRREHPLIDFALFRERLFTGGFFAEFWIGFVYLPMLSFIGSFYMLNVMGLEPFTAGLLILPTTAVSAAMQPLSGRLADRFGPGPVILTGLLLAGLGLLSFGLFNNPDSYTSILPALLLIGIGIGLSMPAGNTSGMLAVDAERAGMGSAVIQMAFVLCNGLGIAFATSITSAVQNSTGDFGKGIAVSMGILGGTAIVCALIAYAIIGKRRKPDHIEITHAAA